MNTDERIDKLFDIYFCVPVLIIEQVAKSAEEAKELAKEDEAAQALLAAMEDYMPMAIITEEPDEDCQ